MPRQAVPVHIFNQNYTLLTEGDPREVEEIAREVDDLMASIASRTSSGDSSRVAVLACFHLADRLREAERRLQKFEDRSERIVSLLEDALDEA